MQQQVVSKALLWTVRVGIWLLLCTPLVVAPAWFFPYITGKNFFFRIVVELFFGAWLALVILDARFRPRGGFVLWAFLGFIGILGLATVFGADPYQSFWSNFERMEGMITYIHLAALFLMASSVFRTKEDWMMLFSISLGVSAVVMLYGLLQSVEIAAVLGGGSGRVFSYLGNPIYLAAYLLLHFFMLGFLMIEGGKQWRQYLYGTLIVSGGLFFFYMAYNFLQSISKELTTQEIANAKAFISNIYVGIYALIHIGMLAALSTWKNNKISFYFIYGCIFISGLYVFFASGTRGALVGFVAGVAAAAVTLFLCSLRDNKRLAVYMSGVIVFGIASVGVFFMARDSAFVARYPLLQRFADINAQSSTAQSRLMIWGIAKDAFKERPVLGWGPGNFIIPYAKYYNPNLYGNEPWYDRVHNMHFEWLIAGGSLGFLAYVLVIVSSLYGLWQIWRNHAAHSAAVAALVGFLVAYLTQNTFVFDNIITYLFFVLFLAFVHSMSMQEKSGGNEKIYPQKNTTFAMVFASCSLIFGIVAAATIHTKSIQVAGGIIDLLNGASAGGTIFSFTNKVDAMVAKQTFGTAEVRERFVDVLFSAARQQQDQASASELSFLLSHGINEVRKELERNSDNIRPFISLAKLLQLRFSITGNTSDRDESIAMYEKAIEKAPRYPSSYIGLAEVYLVAGNTQKASDVMNEIFQEMTRPNTFIYSLLSVSILDGDWERAIQQVKRYESLGNTPLYPAHVYLEPEKLEEVIKRSFAIDDPLNRERFLQALLLVQEESGVLLGLAETAAELEKWDDVAAYISRARMVARPKELQLIDEFENQLHNQ